MRKTRISILVAVTLLIGIGIIMVYSSSAIYAYEKFDDSMYFLKKHLLHVFIGVIGAALTMSINYIKLRRTSALLFILSSVLLLLVFIPSLSQQVGGARRWIKIGIINFQPSEFVKLVFIIWLAGFLAKRQDKITDFSRTFIPAVFVLMLLAGIILMQPDLGRAVTVTVVAFAVFFAAGVRIYHLLAVVISAIPVLYFLVFNVAYRKMRILAFFNPWQDPEGVGFQIIQSYLALGSGGIFGVGLGEGRQKLLYLPAAHTDFIFSIIGEETGLIGAGFIIILFIFLIWQGLKVALGAAESFGRFLSLGIVTMIGLEAIINIGVSIGALPTKGLPLPFISYGGSALVFNMIAVGLLLNIARKDKAII